MDKNIFQRIEKKYPVSHEKFEEIRPVLEKNIVPDEFGRSTLTNIYFDTDDYGVIRESNEMPEYKEKVRIRCYENLTDDAKVFFEIKKKLDHVVYKRRVSMTFLEVKEFLKTGITEANDSQILREIDYAIKRQSLKPKVLLTYNRRSFEGIDDKEFRITFDDNIRCIRVDDEFNPYGEEMQTLAQGDYIMEIKALGGMPLWCTQMLSEYEIYHKRYSKYGAYYKEFLYKNI